MSNEITVTGRLTISAGNLQHNFAPATRLADLASQAAAGGQQVIGTTAEPLTMNTDVAANGYAYFKNISSGVTIDLARATAASSFSAFIRLLPNEFFIARVASTSIYAQAIASGGVETAALQYQVFSP